MGERTERTRMVFKTEMDQTEFEQHLTEKMNKLDELKDKADEAELSAEEMRAKINNMLADTEQKQGSAMKSVAEAAEIAIENSDTYQEAIRIVNEGYEEHEDGAESESESETGE